MAVAHIALGANLGDRRANLDRAVQLLDERPGVRVLRVSSYHETAPVGGPPGQPPYLNAAATLDTGLPPDELLRALLDVEAELGRVRTAHHGPRTLDLDLLIYDDLVRFAPDPVVPHPRMHERSFVLDPLAEIAADAYHPVLRAPVRALQARLTAGPGKELAGLRALVTGSTSGIGKAIALEFAAGGADVIVHGRRSADAAEAVAESVRAAGVSAAVRMADLSEPAECDRLIEEAWSAWGGLDVWVNNAGADTLTGEAAKWPFARKLDALWAVDVRATVALSRAVGGRMRAQGGGVILNVGWDQAETGMEGDSGQLFAATKGAVMAFTRSLALSLAPRVRVNCLAPGWVRTAWAEGASADWQRRAERESPLGRWGLPQDVAAAARWLASSRAAFVTGQTIRVNGGAVR